MEKKYISLFLLGLFGLSGFVDGLLAGGRGSVAPLCDVVFGLLISLTIFYWYRQDSTAKGYARSAFLNVAVVFAAPLVIPVYLVRSNAAGARLKALGRFLGFFCLALVVLSAGAVAGLVIG